MVGSFALGALAISGSAFAGCSPLYYVGIGDGATQALARKLAIIDWQRNVANNYGDLFTTWRWAQNKSITVHGREGRWQLRARGRGCDVPS